MPNQCVCFTLCWTHLCTASSSAGSIGHGIADDIETYWISDRVKNVLS